jgi:hypothetical protein
MEKMISKELLSEVLGIDKRLCRIDEIKENYIFFYTMTNAGEFQNYINIYELAHKCKEWALTEDKCLSSTPYHKELYVCTILGDEMFEAETEPEAIFKACEWILEQIKNKKD